MFEFPKNMMRVFKDEDHQAQFERDGFIVLPFYNTDEIAELSNLYKRLHPKDETGFFPSTFSSDKNYRMEADKEIQRACERSNALYFQDIRVMCGSFIVKSSVPESAMCVHQDMTLVDESKYTGINIWVPLIDLNDQNGTLEVLPRSHRIFPTYRGSSIPEFFAGYSEDIKPYMQKLYPKAGEAIIFDQSIIHYSKANQSGDIRIVTNTYVTHKESTFQTCYWENSYGQKIELFEQSESFMTDFEQFGNNIHARPKVGISKGLVDYNFPKINSAGLSKLYGNPEAANKKKFYTRFFEKVFS